MLIRVFQNFSLSFCVHKVFFASNGEQEAGCENTRAKIKELKEKGLEGAVFYSCEGYHELTVCRNSLREFLPLLFK